MLKFTGKGSITTCDGITRRDFLQVGTLGALGLTLSQLSAAQAAGQVAKGSDDKACIMIFNLGAPSQLDTWDMKPDAPREIRGPFKPINTNNPDIQISEIFPLHAKLADKFSLVRSCYHTAAAVHDTGHQMMQTGRLFTGGINTPHAGCALELLEGPQERTARARHPARADGADRRQSAARPGRRFSRQSLRSVRAECRSFARRISKCPTCCRPRKSAKRVCNAAASCAQVVDDAVKNFEASPSAAIDGRQFRLRLPADDQHESARGL